MTPRQSPIRRLAPFVLPSMLAVGTLGWVLFQGESDQVHSPQDQVAKSSKPTAARVESKARDHRDSRLDRLPLASEFISNRVDPANPQIAGYLESFRKSDKKVSEASVRELVNLKVGKPFKLTAAGIEFSGTLDSKVVKESVTLMGLMLDEDLGQIQISLREDGKVLANVFFNGESHAFSVRGLPENGFWTMTESSVDRLLCAPLGSTFPIARDQMAMPLLKAPGAGDKKNRAPSKALPLLSSNPSSKFVIYCDFDGETVTDPFWNNGRTINATPIERWDDEEFITRIWKRVSEDFAGFDINVTTDISIFEATAEERRMQCVITDVNDAAPGAGGVAILGSFGSGSVCWCFNPTEDSIADTISHEVGHTLGLLHDNQNDPVTGQYNEYYGGHGTGNTSWAPIMGAYFADFANGVEPYDEALTQFSIGEYPGAANDEDDLEIITSDNGFGYRTDDKGNTLKKATALVVDKGDINDAGIIERNDDVDWFVVGTSGGSAVFNVRAIDVNSPETDARQRGANLAVSLELYDSEGELIATSNPADSIDASLSEVLEEGEYYLKVDGVGKGDLTTGFSDYASVGQYTITGTIPQNGVLSVEPPTALIEKSGQDFEFAVSADSEWSWSVDQTWVETNEAVNQDGNQVFNYSVGENTTREDRTATITFKSRFLTATHTITQVGKDDHGDTIDDATLVAIGSSTPGVFEGGGDYDVFRIDVRGFGELNVRSKGTTNTFGELLDAYGKRIASNNNARNPNFSITRPVEAGIYYVRMSHAIEGGTGGYQMVCSFESSPTVIIDPSKRQVSAAGGAFDFRVRANTSWEWSCDKAWVKSIELPKQNGGQPFAYEVLPNTSEQEREAVITIRSENGSVTHRITQRPAGADDHGDTRSKATRLAVNGGVSGEIDSEGDVDMFRLEFATSGNVTVGTTGSMDSFGELLDSKGVVVDSNDNRNGDNFEISRGVEAGTYFVRVRHFDKQGIGSYRLASSFTPSTLVDVNYSASEGGSVRGDRKQKVPLGGAARRVSAVPATGFSFIGWSDGVKSPARTDRNLLSHVNVIAQFVRTMTVRTGGGKELADNQTPPLDFGVVETGSSVKRTFVVRNNGAIALKNLRINKSGSHPEAWTTSIPSRTTLNPGQSASFEVTLKSTSAGFKSANFAIAASGASGSFRLRVMGVVGGSSNATRTKLAGSVSEGASQALQSGSVGKSAGLALGGVSSSWIAVSPDGFFRYRFHRASGSAKGESFWVSTDGVLWEEALILDVWKVSRDSGIDEFEAIIAPPVEPKPLIIVSETPPDRKNP